MPDIRVVLGSTGASLETIARELAGMTDAKVCALFRGRLAAAAAPYPAAVRASALAIPSKGEEPYHQPPGLRARIAACVEVSDGQEPRAAWVSVWMNPSRMPPRQMGLPLYMEGIAAGRHDRWRHPVFGRDKDPWVQQDAHPYFYQAVAPLGPAAGQALGKALDDITAQISG